MNILIDNKKVDFTEDDFPMLISGASKTGASFFSIGVLANLVSRGLKVLLFSAYPAAKEEFKKQIINSTNAIVIESGDEQVFIETMKGILDLSERVVLIKNIDVYGPKLFNVVKNLKLVIFSGDLDECQFADDLLKTIVSKVFFSQSNKYPNKEKINLPKYYGKIISKKYNGIIRLDIKE